MKYYSKYIKPYLYAFIIGPIMMIIEVLGEVVLPKLMADIINVGTVNHDISYIIGRGVIMVICAFLMMAGGIGGAYFASIAAMHFGADLRKDLFKKIQKFSFSNIDHFRTGSLVTRLTNDITQLQNFVMICLRMMLRSPGMFIGGIIMAFVLNPKLAIVILVALPFLAGTVIIIAKIALPRFKVMQSKLDTINTNIQETLTNVRVIKSFVREDHENERFMKSNEDLKETSLNAIKMIVTIMPVLTLLMQLTTMAVVWFGGNQVIVGDMSVGDLTAFITYVTQILMSLMMFAMIFISFSRASASSSRIREVLDENIDLTDDNATQKDLQVLHGDIEFRNAGFKYYKNRDEHVLDNINIKINHGETVGIIGSTGCGKSTLVQMIPRLYDLDEGEVLVDGVNVKEYSLKNLRAGVGMVLQKNVLFSGTIEENLMWGNENATHEEIVAAATASQANDFVQSFLNGYESELGQGGVNISGGQKQRLCIARALLKKPKILILDDSTSAVDTATESRIRESFHNELKDTTKLIIAQRISSVRDADRILVMDDGRIVGDGTHDELLQSCEAYKEIYVSQVGKEDIA